MSKFIDRAAMDDALKNVADNGDNLYLLSQVPVVFADVATYALGHVALTPGDGNGSYIIQAGAVSGKRLTLAQQTVLGTGVGVATYAVIINSGSSTIKMITTAPNYNMTIGGNQTVPSFDVWEIEDPT